MIDSEIIKKFGGKTVKISYREYKDIFAAIRAVEKSGYQFIANDVYWLHISYYRKGNNSYAIIISDFNIYNGKVGVIKYTKEQK